MLGALREDLLRWLDQYLDEMVVFLWDKFEVLVSPSTITRALHSIHWSKKRPRRVADERDADLRDFHLHSLAVFKSEHLVFVDESGCDKRIGFRLTGWSLLGTSPIQIGPLLGSLSRFFLQSFQPASILLSLFSPKFIAWYETILRWIQQSHGMQ